MEREKPSKLKEILDLTVFSALVAIDFVKENLRHVYYNIMGIPHEKEDDIVSYYKKIS